VFHVGRSPGVACLSTFNYGYHIGVLNTPEETIRKCGATEPANGGLPPCFTIDDALWVRLCARAMHATGSPFS